MKYNGEERSSLWILEPDKALFTLVLIVHEEVVNQYPSMAYFGGIFSGGKMNVKAMDYILEHPYPVRATIDVAGV